MRRVGAAGSSAEESARRRQHTWSEMTMHNSGEMLRQRSSSADGESRLPGAVRTYDANYETRRRREAAARAD